MTDVDAGQIDAAPAAPETPPEAPTPAGEGAPPETPSAPSPEASGGVPVPEGGFDELGEFYDSLSPEQVTPDISRLRKEHQQYRERYQPYAERFSDLPEQDTSAIMAFVDAYRSGDDARAAQIAQTWAQALAGQQQPAQPQAPTAAQQQAAQRSLDPNDPSAPLTRAEAEKIMRDAAAAALEDTRTRVARERQEAAAKAAARQQVHEQYEKLGFNLSDPVDMARAQAVANYARQTGVSPEEAHKAIFAPTPEPAPATPPTLDSGNLPPASPDPAEGLSGREAVIARARKRIEDQAAI